MPITNRRREQGGNRLNGRPTFRTVQERAKNGNGHANGNGNTRTAVKPGPPDSTNAENFYYLKQMNARTPMVIVLSDGEEIRGWIEWYDRSALKVNRDGAPNLMIQKQFIKYMYKQGE